MSGKKWRHLKGEVVVIVEGSGKSGLNYLTTDLNLRHNRDTYNISELKAGGFAPRGIASNNTFNDFSNTQDLTQAASQIQTLLSQLQQQGHSPEEAQQQVAHELAEQAKQDPTMLDKLVMWGQRLGDATVTDVVKGVVKLALRSVGVPLP